MLRLPFIVIDQNALSRDALLQPAIKEARRLNLQLMLTDAAIIELVNAADWEKRLRGGLARLARVPDLVTIATPIPELVRIEAGTGRPALDHLEAREYRDPVRLLLGDSQRGRGEALEFFRSRIDETKTRVLPQYVNGEANKRMIQGYVDVFRTEFSPAERKKLVSPAYRQAALASESWTHSLERVIVSLGFCGAGTLARNASVIAHDIFSNALVAAKWYRNSGLECASEDKVTNDLLDTAYAVTASFCYDFASEDSNARNIWTDLVAIAELRERAR